jgi:hypothetical protein
MYASTYCFQYLACNHNILASHYVCLDAKGRERVSGEDNDRGREGGEQLLVYGGGLVDG